jgi:DNA-binding IclR family transcriptional regulator
VSGIAAADADEHALASGITGQADRREGGLTTAPIIEEVSTSWRIFRIVETNERGKIQVIDRAVRILDTIGDNDGATLTAICGQTKLPISTVSRIVGSLSAHGLVGRGTDGRRYVLGPRLLALSSRVRSRPDLMRVARPVLERLSRESREDCALSVLHGTHAVIIDRVDGPNPLKIIDVLGQPEPLYCGAFRKVLLAHQHPEWIDRYLASIRLVRFTPQTITTRRALRRELEAIRTHGYALSFGERLPDAGGVAAPVFGLTDEILAALFIVAPCTRITGERPVQLATLVMAAAQEVTQRLRGEWPGRAEEDRERRRMRR